MIDSKSDLYSSISELESLGLATPKLNELNDSCKMETLVENIKQMLSRSTNLCPYSLIENLWGVRNCCCDKEQTSSGSV